MLTSESDTDAQQVAISQSFRIISTVGSSLEAELIPHRELPTASFKGCPRTTILLSTTQCNTVVLMRVQRLGGDFDEIVKQVVTFVTQDGLTRELLETDPADSIFDVLGSVEFFAGSDDFEPDSRDQFILD